jgi:membrane protease YdiL (CAAX protease family)
VQHNLARRRGPLLAAVITGPLFGLVHLPLRLADGVNQEMLVGLFFAMVIVIGLRVLIGWLYYSTGRSILIAAIVHVTFNATNNGALLLHVRPDSLVVQNLAHFVVAALGVVVIVATRGRLGAPANPAAADLPSQPRLVPGV